MPLEFKQVDDMIKKQIEPVLTRLKLIEGTFKEVLKIAALEKEIAHHASMMALMKDNEKRG